MPGDERSPGQFVSNGQAHPSDDRHRYCLREEIATGGGYVDAGSGGYEVLGSFVRQARPAGLDSPASMLVDNGHDVARSPCTPDRNGRL